MAHYHHLAQLFRALAHPQRLRILDILSEQDACVCHLAAALGQRQPYVSQQLARLKASGLVTERREGNLIYYRACDERTAEILSMGRAWLDSAGAGGPPIHESVPGGVLEHCPCPRCRSARTDAA